MRISLVGLPGVGKSTLGRRLARRLNLRFVDCDACIEGAIGEPIAAYFGREGEARFRDLEESALLDALTQDGVVVATGGGVVLRDCNRALLREKSVCVYLEAELESLIGRLRRSDRRPLFNVPDPMERLRELALLREPLYRQAAVVTVQAAGGAAKVVASIERALEESGLLPGRTGSTER